MTKFKYVGPNHHTVLDLRLAGVLNRGETLYYGKEIDIPDNDKNKILIERLKRPNEPNFEYIDDKRTVKRTRRGRRKYGK